MKSILIATLLMFLSPSSKEERMWVCHYHSYMEKRNVDAASIAIVRADSQKAAEILFDKQLRIWGHLPIIKNREKYTVYALDDLHILHSGAKLK